MPFNLQRFINNYGTGVQVVRQSVVLSNNPETAISGGSLSNLSVVYTGFTFLENGSVAEKNIQDDYGMNTSAIYNVHFFNDLNIKVNDIVKFNLTNHKKNIAFDPTLPIAEISLASILATGFENHNLFKGRLNQ